MTSQSPRAEYWNKTCSVDSLHESPLWRRHSDAVNTALLQRWIHGASVGSVLKTDLFDEAVGDGLYPYLATIGHVVVGIDLSASIGSQAQQHYAGLCALVGDARRLPFPGDAFDIIVSNSTLDHFSTGEEIAVALGEIARVLRPRGHLVITLDNPSNPLVRLRNRLPGAWLRASGIVPYYMGKTCAMDRLSELLAAYGLQVTERTAIVHCPRLIAVAAARLMERRNAKLHKHFLKLLNAFERLERWRTRYRTGYFIAAHAVKPAVPGPSGARECG
jgi:SAM-dependent methyltransferase